ncbi:MAG: radical SAM protein [Candidatus Eisenbacteria bacterium]
MTASKIPSIDYAVNPYLGCEHGCVYCYATFMARFSDIKDEWGTFVGIKENAPDVLRREIPRKSPGVVTFGTVCDAYQQVEEHRGITRACLEEFVGADGFEVGVLTKSDLVTRDTDVLAKLPGANVGISISCLDRELALSFEPRAPSPSRRLAAMRELSRDGIPVWGFFGPVLPGFTDGEREIGEVLMAMAQAGATRVLVDAMNLYPKVRGNVRSLIATAFPERLDTFDAVSRNPATYLPALSERVATAADSVDIEVDVCF